MPAEWVEAHQRHLDEARHNFIHAWKLWRAAGHDEYELRWLVTVAFYTSVHCIEAHLATFGVCSSSHRSRDRNMVNPDYGVPKKVYSAHGVLQMWSEGARYGMEHFGRDEVRSMLDGYLERVMEFVDLRPGTLKPR